MGPRARPAPSSEVEPAVGPAAPPSASWEWFPLHLNQLPPSSVGWEPAGFFGKVKVHLVSISRQVKNIRKVLKKIDKPFGLYPNFLSPVSGNWMQREYRDPAAPP